MKKTIHFDMDGTIADLYAVENWLPKLRAEDASPYIEAKVMMNMSYLARLLNQLQRAGYHISIISWLSKGSSDNYDEAVTAAKMGWLEKHLPSVHFDMIHIMAYGVTKNTYITSPSDILFDDNEQVREDWNGEAYKPNDIFRVLKSLLDEG